MDIKTAQTVRRPKGPVVSGEVHHRGDTPRYTVPRYRAPERPKRVVRRKHTLRRALLRSGALLVVCLLGAGGFLSWRAYTNVHKVFHGDTTVAALSEDPVAPTLLKGEGDGRVNILLLGIGGMGHEGADLTDTIVVLSVDPVNNTAAMLSVPRDMWVKMPVNYFGNYQKINAAYSSGKYRYLGKVDPSNKNAAAVEAGFSAADTAVEDVLGITINYHMLVNFEAFRSAIDTVGGVSVDVKEQLYDPSMAWENNWNPVLAPVGTQQMDGKKALMYARSRETSSDFARAERQRQIMVALKDKVFTAGTLSNPAKIDALMNAFGDNVYTDLSTQGATRLYDIFKKIDDSKISSIGLSTPPHNYVMTDRVGNISVVRPRAGFDNYAGIQSFVRSQLPDGYVLKEKAPVTILAATQKSVDESSAEFKSYGYSVVSTGVVAPQNRDKPILVDLSKGSASYTKNYLERRLGVRSVTQLPAGVILPAMPGTSAPKFVIIEPK